jgi:glycosyltransferase involved in cell wall biosynthesis
MIVGTQKHIIEAGVGEPGSTGLQVGFSGHGLPLVSILIPTHNRPDCAELALKSALAQTYPHIEIIVNDSSDDPLTQERFAPYIQRYPHIHYARVAGCGVMENFQYCYDRAIGEYVNYLMDDDLFYPEKIQKMMSFMLAKPSIGLVTSFRQLIDSSGAEMAPIAGTERTFEIDTLVGGRSLGNMILSNDQNMIGEPTAVLFRKSDVGDQFGRFCGKQYTTLSDVATWLSILSHRDCVYLPEALSYFRMHGGQDQRSNCDKINASVEWLELFCDAYQRQKFFTDQTLALEVLSSKLVNGLLFLLPLREEVKKLAYSMERLKEVLQQGATILFGDGHGAGQLGRSAVQSVAQTMVQLGGTMEQPVNGSVLIDYFENCEHRMIHKWMHYFEIYERHFAQFRNQPISLLEFGVLHGGSLQMWKYYFGPHAKIYGADINPRCAELAEDQISILLTDQESRESLQNICKTLPPFEIIIDDGGHTMLQQTTTFEEMWGQLKIGGVYLVEDMLTSYWPAFGGGYKNPVSFVEYTKGLIDQLNAWHAVPNSGLEVNGFTRTAFAMHYYDSVLVIEKRAMQAPHVRMKGKPSFPLAPAEQAVYDKG